LSKTTPIPSPPSLSFVPVEKKQYSSSLINNLHSSIPLTNLLPLMDWSPIDFRKELNDEQYAAVTAQPGPSLVLAGAGSGKTRTLTYRVAWLLLEKRVHPNSLLLLTFTNK